jgi:transmembrane sensor
MATPPKPPFELPPTEGPSGDPLIREGVAWLVHLNSGDETPEDWAAFDAWQQASEDHKAAAAKAKGIWEQIGPTLAKARKSRNRNIPVILAAAVGLSGLAFFGGLFGPPASYFADHRSSTGEVRSVVLRDGSEIDLDTGTSFDVSDGDRTITLYTGQVFVKVKPGNSRPFRVVAGDAQAQALGTAFAVRRDGDHATVAVSESAVRVTDARRSHAPPVDIATGQAVTLSGTAGLGVPQAADIRTLTAWRRGELVFTRRPLGEVVAELDRYRTGKILILGSTIRNLPVTGSVEINDVDAFLTSLQIALPVRVLRLPGLATIRRDSSR